MVIEKYHNVYQIEINIWKDSYDKKVYELLK